MRKQTRAQEHSGDELGRKPNLEKTNHNQKKASGFLRYQGKCVRINSFSLVVEKANKRALDVNSKSFTAALNALRFIT